MSGERCGHSRWCGDCFSPEHVERLEASHEKERAAWARLVKAERAYIGGGTSGGTVRALDEYDAAKQALRDLGVDVDALLEERPEDARLRALRERLARAHRDAQVAGDRRDGEAVDEAWAEIEQLRWEIAQLEER